MFQIILSKNIAIIYIYIQIKFENCINVNGKIVYIIYFLTQTISFD